MLSCEYARCGSAAVWGFDDEGQARFCDRHKADGMVNFLNSSALPPRDIEAGARQQQPRVGMVAGDAYGEVQYPETKAAFEDPTVRADFVKKVVNLILRCAIRIVLNIFSADGTTPGPYGRFLANTDDDGNRTDVPLCCADQRVHQ